MVGKRKHSICVSTKFEMLFLNIQEILIKHRSSSWALVKFLHCVFSMINSEASANITSWPSCLWRHVYKTVLPHSVEGIFHIHCEDSNPSFLWCVFLRVNSDQLKWWNAFFEIQILGILGNGSFATQLNIRERFYSICCIQMSYFVSTFFNKFIRFATDFLKLIVLRQLLLAFRSCFLMVEFLSLNE